jgi:chromosome segregation and condensation protein ScpB
MENLENIIESVVFVAGEPVLISDLCFKFDVKPKQIEKAVEKLNQKYDENSGIVLLLDNGEQLFLETLYTGLGSTMYGSGSFIFSTVFELSNEEVEILKVHKITDIRIKYFGGHYDKSLKSNKQVLIMKMLNLF